MSRARPIKVDNLPNIENRPRTRKYSTSLEWSAYEHAMVDFGEWAEKSYLVNPDTQPESKRWTSRMRKIDILFIDSIAFIEKSKQRLRHRMRRATHDAYCRIWRTFARVRGRRIKEEKSGYPNGIDGEQ